MVYQQLGMCYYETKKNEYAEKAYLTAVYMAPNRFSTRFNLLNFYTNTGQQTKALIASKAIMTLPVKLGSPQIKKETKKIMHNLETGR